MKLKKNEDLILQRNNVTLIVINMKMFNEVLKKHIANIINWNLYMIAS